MCSNRKPSRASLSLGQPGQPGGEPLVDEQGLTAAHRMGADHRVAQGRVTGHGRLPALARLLAVIMAMGREGLGEVMLGFQPCQQGLQGRGEGRQRRDAAGPEGVPGGGNCLAARMASAGASR